MTTTTVGPDLSTEPTTLLTAHWPEVTATADGDMLAFWAAAAAAGWTNLPGLGSLESISRALGRAACPFPIGDLWAAGQVLGSEAVADGSLRPAVVPHSAVHKGTVKHLEAPTALTHVLVLDAQAREARLYPVLSATKTPGTAIPAWGEVVIGPAAQTTAVGANDVERLLGHLRLALAVRAFGAAERSHDLALEHAKNRTQFGRRIGSFQAVQHRTVNCAIEVEINKALAADAVLKSTQAGTGQAPALAAETELATELVVAHAVERARFVQFEAGHTLAAQGYFENHPAPWLFRRVQADISRIAEYPTAAGTVADRLIESKLQLPSPQYSEAAEAFRTRLRADLHQWLPEGGSGRLLARDEEFLKKAIGAGLLGMDWSVEDGGRGATAEEAAVLAEEFAYGRMPIGNVFGGANLLGQSILKFGTAEQRSDLLPRLLRGEINYFLGYSEPDVGSDLASLQTSARLDGDEWVINGTKSWGTATRAEYAWLAARTDPDAQPRHAGISVFLFSLDRPGISVERLTALTGESHAITSFDNVRVPASALVGDVNGGWKVIANALAQERISMAALSATTRRLFDDMIVHLSEPGTHIAGPRGSAERREITRLATRLQGARLLSSASRRAAAEGANAAGFQAPMAKVVGTTTGEELTEFLTSLLGPDALLSDPAHGAPLGGHPDYQLRLSLMNTVGGGTNDIQRNLLARALGMPKN
jgi:alkylation response protein AidB-like acyl-CoA dehydrogenase